MNITTKQQELYNWLPKEFTRQMAIDVCKGIGLNERYFDNSMRRKSWSSKFERVFFGQYKKIE